MSEATQMEEERVISVDLNDSGALRTLPDDSEAKLVITRVQEVPVRRDERLTQLALTFDVVDDPTVEDIRAWVPIPSSERAAIDAKDNTKAMHGARGYIAFANCFSIPGDSLPSDMLGKEGWCKLSEEEDTYAGGLRNSIRDFQAPH